MVSKKKKSSPLADAVATASKSIASGGNKKKATKQIQLSKLMKMKPCVEGLVDFLSFAKDARIVKNLPKDFFKKIEQLEQSYPYSNYYDKAFSYIKSFDKEVFISLKPRALIPILKNIEGYSYLWRLLDKQQRSVFKKEAYEITKNSLISGPKNVDDSIKHLKDNISRCERVIKQTADDLATYKKDLELRSKQKKEGTFIPDYLPLSQISFDNPFDIEDNGVPEEKIDLLYKLLLTKLME